MTIFASILAILALLTGGGAGTVYAAQDSMPNEMLYSLKIASEEFRLNMADDPDQELALMLQFAQRRSDEIQSLMAEGIEPTAETMLQLSQQTQQAMQMAGELDGTAMLQVQSMMQNQLQQMLNLPECESEECTMLMEQTRTMLQTQLMLADGEGQGQQQGPPDEDAGQGQDEPQGQAAPNEDAAQGEGGPNEDAGQGQDEPQGQGAPSEDSGQPDGSPGAGNAGGAGAHNGK